SMMGAVFNSMDYLYRPVSYTPARTAVDADGKVRLILAHDDPGYHNWLDTQGFTRGNLTYRNIMSSDVTRFRTRRVKRGELGAAPPRGSARGTPGERAAQMRPPLAPVRQPAPLEDPAGTPGQGRRRGGRGHPAAPL